MEHLNIPDSDRHEVKHASTAVAGQVLKSVGAGVTAFGSVAWTEVTGKPTVTGYSLVLQAQSVATSQTPTATNTPLQVEFGPAQTGTDVSIAANGTVTFNTAGQYLVQTFMRMGRNAAVGDVYLFSRSLVNDVQLLNSNAIRLGNQDAVIPFASQIGLTAAAGQTYKIQIMRDSSGINAGGLYQLSPTLSGWAAAPTATIVVSKFVGYS